MFGSSSPFGQSSSSPFGSKPVFGQTSSASSNSFAQNPFGSPNPFGSSTGSSVFGGTSTGVFGQPSTPAFGVSSTPTFGSPTPAFGASSTPAFGSSSSPFGGSSVFGQKPTFGGFGSTNSQTSPFGSSLQQTQPAFRSSPFGSTSSFGTLSQPAFGATTAPAFGSTSTPAFGSTTTPAFGATTAPAFGATTAPAFGSTSTSFFGNTGTAFGASSTPAFGSPAAPAFGASSSPAFGGSITPTFGSSTAPGFGASTTPSFGFGSTSSLGQSTSTFGQSTSTFGSTPFGTTPSPFGLQTAKSAFGSPGFGQSAPGGQHVGSRPVAYTPTFETDGGCGTQPAGKLETISAMPVHKAKSHEELRWEDYQLGDKGGPNPAGQHPSRSSFPAPTQTSPFSTSIFGQTAANPASNPFMSKNSTIASTNFGSSSSSIFSSPFIASSSSPFGSTSSTPSLFVTSSGPAFGSSSSPFSGSSAPAFSSSCSFFGSSATGSSSSFISGLNFPNTQSSGLFQSSTPSIGQTPSPFGQPSTGFQQATPGFGSNPLSAQSTGFGGSLFNNSALSSLPTSSPVCFSQPAPSPSIAFQHAGPTQTSSGLSFGNFGQAQTASSGGFGSISNIFSRANPTQLSSATQATRVMQPAILGNPFGTLPGVPQMSIGHVGSAPSIQYGISSMPVAEKSVPVRVSSLSAPRHLSQISIRLPARKYHPRSDGPRVPFFSYDEVQKTPKADAFFIPRENPRALVIRPIEPWPSRTSIEKWLGPKEAPPSANGNGKVSDEPSCLVLSGPKINDPEGSPAENGHIHQHNTGPPSPSKAIQKPNGVHADHAPKETDPACITISSHRTGEGAIVYEHRADVEALMPKLPHGDYYTKPQIRELAAKERAEPGFCRHVKDFVVGRHGYGSIKFDGETDVRRLELNLIVQFNNREVIVYKDELKKPPVGEGLNKPAEVTLLNIKCINKKTGLQYTEGPKVDKYKDMLMKETREQGAELMSYNALKGEWKFKVQHFSSYGLKESFRSHAVL